MASVLEELEIISSFLELVVNKIENIKSTLKCELTEISTEFDTSTAINYVYSNCRINDAVEKSFPINQQIPTEPIIKIEEEYGSHILHINEGSISSVSMSKEYEKFDDIKIEPCPVISEVNPTVEDSESLKKIFGAARVSFEYPRSYQCDQCDFVTRHKGNIKMHIDVHHFITKFKCETCGRTFDQKRSLWRHKRSCHGPLSFQCEKCAYSSRVRGHLKRHTDNVHHKIKKFKCEACGFAFGLKHSMKKHMNHCQGHLGKTTTDIKEKCA